MISFSLARAENMIEGSGGVSNTTDTSDRSAVKTTYDVKQIIKRETFMADRKAFEDKLTSERDTFKTEVEKRRMEFRTASIAMKTGFWKTAGEIIRQRFVTAIANLERVQNRASDMIDQLNTDGQDTTVATDDLNLSKQKLDEAKTKLAAAKALLPTDGNKVTADIFAQIKLDLRAAKDLLKESRNDLFDVIKEIRSLKGEDAGGNN